MNLSRVVGLKDAEMIIKAGENVIFCIDVDDAVCNPCLSKLISIMEEMLEIK